MTILTIERNRCATTVDRPFVRGFSDREGEMLRVYRQIFFGIFVIVFTHFSPASPTFAQTYEEVYETYDNGDYTAARAQIQIMLDRGEDSVLAILGAMQYSGLGGPVDYAKAAESFSPLAERGYIFSQYMLGRIYETGGSGVTRDYGEAYRWYSSIIEANSLNKHKKITAFAHRKVAQFNLFGRGLEINERKAAKWFISAAQIGDLVAQASLGQFYKNGAGFQRNPAAAELWLRRRLPTLSGDALAKAEKVLAELDVQGFLAARQEWRQGFAPWRRPFGIVLGRRYPAEVEYDLEDTFRSKVVYRGVSPPSPVSIRNVEDAIYSAAVTNGDFVYRVSAVVMFDSARSCRAALDDYFEQVPNRAGDGLIRRRWKLTTNDDRSVFDSFLFVADFDGKPPFSNARNPIESGIGKGVGGVRLQMTCGNDLPSLGKIDFIHYPTADKWIAARLQADSLWWGYAKTALNSSRPDYMQVYGVALGLPLPTAVPVLTLEQLSDADLAEIAVPLTGSLFQQFRAFLTPISGLVYRIESEASFSNKNRCQLGLDEAIAGLTGRFAGLPIGANRWFRLASAEAESATVRSSIRLKASGVEVNISETEDFPPNVSVEEMLLVPELRYRVRIEADCSLQPSNQWRGVLAFEDAMAKQVKPIETFLKRLEN
jgi:Sel1 repeat